MPDITYATMTAVFLTVIVLGFTHTTLFAILSRVRQSPPRAAEDGPFFVFVIPCLNEELVISRSLDKLLSMTTSRQFAVLVIDDGSEDETAAIVGRYGAERVWLLRRRPPEARQGKGAALNSAYRFLLESDALAGRDPRQVVVAVLDADGRLRPDALDVVSPYFARPEVGAVQIGVRMYNVDESLLARMQDIEFVVFTEIYQRARRHLGTVGLGGNGQFVRLAALRSLDEQPWTDCLTEDLNLGIRLRLNGWFSEFTGETWVEQQAVTSVSRLVRQRSRWFQGHLQCGKLVPLIVRSRRLSAHAAVDLSWHLLSPLLILAMSAWSTSFLATLAYVWVTDPTGSWEIVSTSAIVLPVFYLLSLSPAVLYALVYRSRTQGLSILRSLVVAHFFVVYGYMWFLAGWRAVWQTGTGKRGWAKTARTAEQVVPEAAT